jgi:hypothetical protein
MIRGNIQGAVLPEVEEVIQCLITPEVKVEAPDLLLLIV